MVDIPKRPLSILPWVSLDGSYVVGGSSVGHRGQLHIWFSEAENEQTAMLARSFRVPRGWSGDTPRTEAVLNPCFCSMPQAGPQTMHEQTMMRQRVDYAAHIVGADTLAHNPNLRAGNVQPFPFELHPREVPGAFPILDGLGKITIVPLANLMTIRPVWLSDFRYPYTLGLAETLGQLVDDALVGNERNSKTLASLQWFVQSYGHDLHTLHLGDGPNLVALSTAFEVLLEIGKDKKAEVLEQRVHDLTGRDTLGRAAHEFYEARNRVVHAGKDLYPQVRSGTISVLRFARKIFWLCLRAVLERDHGVPWLGQYGARANDTHHPERLLNKDACADRLVAHLTSNHERLRRIADMRPEDVSQCEEAQAEFVTLLDELLVNEVDASATKKSIERFLQRSFNIIRAVLERKLLAFDSATQQSMRDFADRCLTVATNPDVDIDAVVTIAYDVRGSREPWMDQHIIDGRSLHDLFREATRVGTMTRHGGAIEAYALSLIDA